MFQLLFDDTTPGNIQPAELNSGILWSTKMSGKRIGDNGSEPGVRIFMLSDLKKEIGVILFIDTSLLEHKEAKFYGIYNDRCQHGIQLKKASL